jgi:hypothetical protein
VEVEKVNMKELIPIERIENEILLIRAQKVMLAHDLAELYGVPTRRLNEQVKRNIGKFPKDFMFQLTDEELEDLRSQFATAKLSKARTNPYAFTEHGALMSANVLNSPKFLPAGKMRLRRVEMPGTPTVWSALKNSQADAWRSQVGTFDKNICR